MVSGQCPGLLLVLVHRYLVAGICLGLVLGSLMIYLTWDGGRRGGGGVSREEEGRRGQEVRTWLWALSLALVA